MYHHRTLIMIMKKINFKSLSFLLMSSPPAQEVHLRNVESILQTNDNNRKILKIPMKLNQISVQPLSLVQTENNNLHMLTDPCHKRCVVGRQKLNRV